MKRRKKRPSPPPSHPPTLRFTPLAWAKLLYLRDLGPTEVGGFGITADDDPLRIEDVCLVRQECSYAYVAFDDDAVAEFFDDQVDAGRRPEQFARIWLHTHPGDSAQPSQVDEETFDRVFGPAHWAVMFILAQEGETYARLRFNVGPGADQLLPVEIDYGQLFGGCDHAGWQAEYLANVRCDPRLISSELAEWTLDDEWVISQQDGAQNDDAQQDDTTIDNEWTFDPLAWEQMLA